MATRAKEEKWFPPLSSCEYMILSAVQGNPRQGLYGADIKNGVMADFGKSIPFGVLYATLGRLVEKGLLERVGGDEVFGSPDLRRQYYRLTTSGAWAMSRMQCLAMTAAPDVQVRWCKSSEQQPSFSCGGRVSTS